jgi:hypothetical protein
LRYARLIADLFTLEVMRNDAVSEGALFVRKPHRGAIETHCQAMLEQLLHAIFAMSAGRLGLSATLSPGATRVTPWPTASTVPAIS